MFHHVALVIPIWILVAPVPGQAQHSSVKDKDDIEKFFQSKDAPENLYLFHDFIRRWGSDRLRSLKHNADPSVALRAAWEEVRATIPEERRVRPVTVDATRLYWFVGFIEGRLNLELPDYWVKGFVRAEAFRRDNVVFHHLDESMYHATKHNLRVPRGTSVENRDSGVELTVGKDSITIPTRQFEEMVPSALDHLSAFLEHSRCYLLAYDGFPSGGTLYCLERASAKIIWTKELWLSSEGGGYSGVSGFHGVSLTKKRDCIYVIGIAESAAYAEVCQAKDGAILFRFATNR
jgi:hypothetical protein